MDSSERRAWIFFNRVPNLFPRRFFRLVEEAGSAMSLLSAPDSAQERWELPQGILGDWQQRWRSGSVQGQIDQELRLESKGEFRMILAGDAEYPPRLHPLDDRPPVLYIRGRWPLPHAPAVGVVGTRKASPPACRLSQDWARDLAQAGCLVVSGLAAGVDAAAHQGALDGGGWTAGVIGSGLSVMYPDENKKLYQRMKNEGTIISEFPYDAGPLPWRFPQRNRIISGLSDGVVVIEAGLKSGAMITARWAADQGREVMAAPGSLWNPHVRGCHFLIKEGARLVESSADILDVLGLERPGSAAPCPANVRAPEENVPELSREEARVFSLLKREPLTVDELQAKTGLAVDLLMTTLLSLELKSRIRKYPGLSYGSQEN